MGRKWLNLPPKNKLSNKKKMAFLSHLYYCFLVFPNEVVFACTNLEEIFYNA